jgi:ABC-type iron transport system FetAB permease component
MTIIDISYGQLLLSLVFVLVAGIASIRMSLGLERDDYRQLDDRHSRYA